MTAAAPFVLGLTGSIGMGKSTTAQLFREAGVPVFDADAAVHAIYAGEGRAAIEQAFPGTVMDGAVDRRRLAERLRGRPEAWRLLESIVHPLVHAREQAFMAEAVRAGAPVVVLDIPLLLEGKSDARVDAVVVVSAPAEVQRARVMERPGMTEALFAELLGRQIPDEEKRRRADFIVDSSRGLDPVRVEIQKILAAAPHLPRRRPQPEA